MKNIFATITNAFCVFIEKLEQRHLAARKEAIESRKRSRIFKKLDAWVTTERHKPMFTIEKNFTIVKEKLTVTKTKEE